MARLHSTRIGFGIRIPKIAGRTNGHDHVGDYGGVEQDSTSYGTLPSEFLAALGAARPLWHNQAACRGRYDVMFPTPGTGRSLDAAISAALALCTTCPVSEKCAAAGEREGYGVWAGVHKTSGRSSTSVPPNKVDCLRFIGANWIDSAQIKAGTGTSASAVLRQLKPHVAAGTIETRIVRSEIGGKKRQYRRAHHDRTTTP